MVDARLPDGSRVNAIVPPLAIRGAVLTIRKFPNDPLTMADLINLGAIGLDAAEFLEACVRGRINILVSGGTSTGKTTFLNVLSSFIPDHERIITVEDAAELQLQQPHVVSLEARPPNAEGAGEVRIRDLVKNCLRMRPDRIVVGECRGAEALDMLQAMHTGHEGSMTTVHANDPRDARGRRETMIMMAGYDLPLKAVRDQIASGLNLIVHLARSPEGARRVVGITEVHGLEGDVVLLQDLFLCPADGGALEPTGLRPRLLERLTQRGVHLPASLFRNEALLAAATAGLREGVGPVLRPGRVAPPPLAELRRGGGR
jgi:pilus assembly protein CpaF